jgi:hypothetical protein
VDMDCAAGIPTWVDRGELNAAMDVGDLHATQKTAAV